MAAHTANIQWERTDDDPSDVLIYNRNHTWTFDNGLTVAASGAPEFRGDPTAGDPEESFVAAVSSCHMLAFLWITMQEGFCPTSYGDQAVGYLKKNERGKLAITEDHLSPRLTYKKGLAPSKDQEKVLHHRAHEECFIANSIKSNVTVMSE